MKNTPLKSDFCRSADWLLKQFHFIAISGGVNRKK